MPKLRLDGDGYPVYADQVGDGTSYVKYGGFIYGDGARTGDGEGDGVSLDDGELHYPVKEMPNSIVCSACVITDLAALVAITAAPRVWRLS